MERKDHYLSQSYLKGFTDPASPRDLWVYPFNDPSWRPMLPKDIAWEPGYYGDVDSALRIVENNSAPALRRARRMKPISDDDRVALCYLVSTIMGRSPALIEAVGEEVVSQVQALHRTWYERCREDPSELVRLMAEMTDAGFQPDEPLTLEDLEPSKIAFNSHSPGIALETLKAAATLVPTLMSMRWVFVVAPRSDFFVTSDHPFFAIDRTAPVRGRYGFAALGDPNVKATLPLGRRVALYLWKGPPGPVEYRQVDSEAVADVNFRTTWPAARFIAGPSRTFAGSDEVLRLIAEGREKFKPSRDH